MYCICILVLCKTFFVLHFILWDTLDYRAVKVSAKKFSNDKEQASRDYYVINVHTMELHTSDIFHLEAIREVEVVRLSQKLLSYV